jgi:uncharacterized protein
MKWKRGKRSPNLRDRRSETGGAGGFPGGGGMPIPMPGGKMGGGIGTIIIVVILFFVLRSCGGGDGGGFNVPGPSGFPQAPGPEQGQGQGQGTPGPDAEAKQVDFVSFVLDDVQGFWVTEFQGAGKQYENAQLNLFRDQIQSGCGGATSAVGPFYCPLDKQIYIDLAFFDELNRRFKAPGDFAQAYVIAHEFGHHVQQQLGIEEEVRSQSEQNPDDANELSIRLELQADCFAGLWGRSAFDEGLLESGDLEEGIGAAEAVGDDRIQEQTQGRIDPESWTHGSSEQRQTWFRKGYDSGELSECDTFAADEV